jgi:RecA-family ATPase
LFGASGEVKSTFARSLSLAVSRGEPFLGRITTKGTVLYLALEESSRQLTSHFRALGATEADEILIFAGRAPSTIIDAMAVLREKISEHKPVLVVIDTLARLIRLKDFNAYAETTAGLDHLLAAARDLGAHVLFLHHAPKGKPREAIDSALGSAAIAGSVDTLAVLRKTERHRTIVTEQREGEGFAEETILHFDPETRGVSLGPSRQHADEHDAATVILEWLKDQPKPVEEKAILAAVQGRTAPKVRALRKLVEEKRVIRTGGGKKGDPFRYAIAPEVAPDHHDRGSTNGHFKFYYPDSPFVLGRRIRAIRLDGKPQQNGG